MLLQVWEKAHLWDTALLVLYFLSRKKNVIVQNEDVTYSSELAFLLFCGSLKAICNLKLGSIFPVQAISWLTHLQISLWIALRISLRIIQMSNYGLQTPWLLSGPRMDFLNIWEKILNFVQVGSKCISLCNKESRRLFEQGGGYVDFILCNSCRSGWALVSSVEFASLWLSASWQLVVGSLWTDKGTRKERREKTQSIFSLYRTLGWCHL